MSNKVTTRWEKTLTNAFFFFLHWNTSYGLLWDSSLYVTSSEFWEVSGERLQA